MNLRRLLQGGIGLTSRVAPLEVVTIPFSRIDEGLEEIPLWEQPWAMRALKLIMGGLIIIVLILAPRPMLKRLIYPEDTTEQEEFNVDQP